MASRIGFLTIVILGFLFVSGELHAAGQERSQTLDSDATNKEPGNSQPVQKKKLAKLDVKLINAMCHTILNMGSGEDTLRWIQLFTEKTESRNAKEFLANYGADIECFTRSFMYFVLYKGHDDDLKALLDAGHDVNSLIQDNRGRSMTMLDYIYIVYNEEENPIYKSLIRKKILRIRRAGGKTCQQLGRKDCRIKIESRS